MCSLQSVQYFTRVCCVFFGYRNDAHLNRGKPERERSSIFLNEKCHYAFNGTDRRTMYNKGTMLRTILSDIGQVKSFWHAEVILDRKSSIFFPVYVLHLNVNLRSVEGRLTLRLFELRATRLHQCAKESLGLFPSIIIFIILFYICTVTERETVAIVCIENKSEDRCNIFYQVKYRANFCDRLFFVRTDNV